MACDSDGGTHGQQSPGKDRGRVKGSQARGKKDQAPVGGGGPEEADAPAESPASLCSVLCRWTPVFSPAQGQTPRPPDRAVPSDLAKDTALLLAKWSLRSLLETPSSSSKRTKDFLHWLETAVIGHELIADALVLDVAFKADLLRLYHRAFESNPNAPCAETTDLRLFTRIMMRLLESQGQLPGLHRAVASACLPDEAGQRSGLDAGLFLSSLYVHELWSGVPSAELFMSHVRAVTKPPAQTKETSGALSECPVRAICSDIIRATKE